MGLREAVNAGLREMSKGGTGRLELDERGRCDVPVPLPPSLVGLSDGRLIVQIQMSRGGNRFSLTSPVAIMSSGAGKSVLEAMLIRHLYADQLGGASFALNAGSDAEQDTLLASYHWMLDTITPDLFSALFRNFIAAVLLVIEEVADMSLNESYLDPIHEGRPGRS